VWRLAIVHAQAAANEALVKEQNAIAADRASLNQEAKVWQGAVEAAQREAAEATSKWMHMQVQLSERDALLEQFKVQQTDLLQQRDRLQAAVAQYQADIERLQAERTAALDHARVAEDRAHRLVDEARQDTKALQLRLAREERETNKRIAQLTDQTEHLRKAVNTAEQATARETGRVLALESTLKQLRGALPPKKTKTVLTKKTKTRAKRSGRAEHA
jgi:chromosome segregation ATPase